MVNNIDDIPTSMHNYVSDTTFTISMYANKTDQYTEIDSNLPLMWSNFPSRYDVNDAYAITVEGSIFRFVLSEDGLLSLGEVFAHGIKICNIFTLQTSLSNVLVQKKYKISILLHQNRK